VNQNKKENLFLTQNLESKLTKLDQLFTL